jgi:hypothetical protein
MALVRQIMLGLVVASAVGCSLSGSSLTVDGVTMLRTGVTTGGPTALIRGTLDFRDGCIWLQEAPEASVIVLWPSHASLDNSLGVLSVTIDSGRFVDGDELTLGGGELEDLDFVRTLVGPIPENCITDRYWQATSLVEQ